MTNSQISNAVITMISSFLSNSGAEVAKNIGKDVYEKVKHSLKKPDEKQALNNLETEPFSILYQKMLEKILMTKLVDRGFFQEVSVALHISTVNTYILTLVLNSIGNIKDELEPLYRWWINAGPDKKGEYKNRIEQLEKDLIDLEGKFLSIIQTSIQVNPMPEST
jgi:hypothetical protein